MAPLADDRTYIRVHDGMPGHPKIRGLSDKAFRTMVSAWCYCSEYLTDGEVVADVARDLGTKRAWDELVSRGIAETAPAGFLMHDYLQHQRSAAEVAEIKAGRGAGGTLGNHVRWHVQRRKPDPSCEHCIGADRIANGSQERYEGDSDGRSQTDRPGSHSHKQRQIQREPSYEGGSHVSSGTGSALPRFPDHCRKHADVPVPGKCGDCKDTREANALAAEQVPRLSIVATVPAKVPHCGECDQYRMRETPFGLIRCPECHPLAEEAS